jgi:hypothetical protein
VGRKQCPRPSPEEGRLEQSWPYSLCSAQNPRNFCSLGEAAERVALEVEDAAEVLWDEADRGTFEPQRQLRRQGVHERRAACCSHGCVEGCCGVHLEQDHGLAAKMREPEVYRAKEAQELPLGLPCRVPSGGAEERAIAVGPIRRHPLYWTASQEEDRPEAKGGRVCPDAHSRRRAAGRNRGPTLDWQPLAVDVLHGPRKQSPNPL